MYNINSLKEKIKSLINISVKNVFEYTKRETLNSKLERVKDVEKSLKIEKYKIVFIGTIGAGKTTAISHLFNLTSIVDKTIKRGNKSRTIKVVEPLFSTGSGRTTICEVEIKSSQNTYIQIEPYTRDELKREIEEFCESFYKEDSQKNILSIELERAVRAIIKLKETTKRYRDENGEISIKKIDYAKEKAQELSSVDKFIEYALREAELDNRVYTLSESKISFDKLKDKDEKIWLKNNFSKINRGNISHFSIPKKINIYIDKEVFGESSLDIFDSVIDTKGIDENPIREDLINYIEDENTICIFTSSYNDAPETNIRELITYSLSKKSKKYKDKFITLVMPKNNEPENENDANGDREQGIAIKKSIIKKVFKNMRLEFNNDNILFYDALEFYDLTGQIDRGYEDDIQETKDELIDNIKNIIKKRKENLQQEIIDVEDNISGIKEVSSLSEKEEKDIDNLIQKLKNIRDLNKRVPSFIYNDFVNNYIDYYSTRYRAWNTKDAIHRRYGIFPERGYSTYYDAKVVAEGLTKDDMLQKFTNELKKEVEELIDDLGRDVKTISDLTPEIKRVFEQEYDNFLSKVGQGVKTFLEEENKNRYFWLELIERRGKGRGYNNDVAKIFHDKLMSFPNALDINGVFQDYTEEEWENLIDKVLIFFKKDIKG